MPKSRVAIIGLGQVGGSIGLALKKANLEIEIVGHDKDPGISGKAQKRGAVDSTKWNLIDACDGAGLIILALPLDGIRATLDALKPHLVPGTLITDTATTKVPVLEWATSLPAGVHFVGGNPVIKPSRVTTDRGIEGASADFFQEATYCLVAAPSASGDAIDTMANWASALGAKPYFIDAAEHDGLMAGVQHLPTLLAATLASVTMQSTGWRELAKLASNDFRTATEIVPTDDKSAREQILAHREDILRWMDLVADRLQSVREMLEKQDVAGLEAMFKAITLERAKWLAGAVEEKSQVDWDSTKMSPARLFLGGLADAGKKKR